MGSISCSRIGVVIKKMTVNNLKQKIRTINAKALFKYFPKEKGDKVYAIYLINKALCRHVIKQEEDMEECPVFYQFYKEINKERSENAHTYIDAFGIKRDLGKARIFITESMFKAKKWILEYLKNTGEEDMDPMVFYCEMLKKSALLIPTTNLHYQNKFIS